MLLRVSCPSCRLFPAWTDDPDGLLGTVCNRPFRCNAQLNDEQAIDVTGHYMEERHRAFCALAAERDEPEASPPPIVERSRSRAWLAATVSCLTAWVVCREMTSAYESASLVSMGLALGTAPFLALVAYGSSLTGLGRVLAPDVVDWRVASLTFLVALPILFTIALPSTLRAVHVADARLIRGLVRHTKADEGSLVITQLDPAVAEKARQRIAVRAGGRTYDLSDASKRTRDQRVTLVLHVAGNPMTEEVEFEGLRGPTTTYSERVTLASAAGSVR